MLKPCPAGVTHPSLLRPRPSTFRGIHLQSRRLPAAAGCLLPWAALAEIAVLKRQEGRIEILRVVPVTPAPAGNVLTPDGKPLIAPASTSAVVPDVARMITGGENPIVGTFSGVEKNFCGSVYT